jgi:hypothetical protein
MTLYSFGFAVFLIKALPASSAGTTLRLAFAWFYLFVVATAAPAALFWCSYDTIATAVKAAVALSTMPVRQLLMSVVNPATDFDDRWRFKSLHRASVLATLSHIALTGFVLAGIV